MDSMVASGSVAHTFGNVTFQMTELIKSYFPMDFFRHTHISTRMAFRENKREENNSRYEFIKKNRPILVVKPRLIMGDNDIWLTNSLLTNDLYGRDIGNYFLFFKDIKNKIALRYLLNRIRAAFDVTIMLDTEFQQLNIYNHLMNKLTDNCLYYYKTALEFYIPKSLIQCISMMSGNLIRDNNNSVKPFLDYMNMNSAHYMTFKEATSVSSEEFYMYYPLTIEWVPTDFSLSEPEKRGFVTSSCNINFTITAEFNNVGRYQLAYEESNKAKIANMSFGIDMNEGTVIKPFYTLANLFTEYDENGWKLYYTNLFYCEGNHKKGEPEILDLSPVLNDDRTNLKDIYAYHKKNGISNKLLFNFIVMRNSEKLSDKLNEDGKRDYEIDFENFQLKIYKISLNSTYRLIIYINNLYVTNLMNTINHLDTAYEAPVHKKRKNTGDRRN